MKKVIALVLIGWFFWSWSYGSTSKYPVPYWNHKIYSKHAVRR